MVVDSGAPVWWGHQSEPRGPLEDRVESVLVVAREMAYGSWCRREHPLAADDRDRRVSQARRMARHVPHVGLAAVFVVGEVAHAVQAALDVPAVADHGRHLLR